MLSTIPATKQININIQEEPSKFQNNKFSFAAVRGCMDILSEYIASCKIHQPKLDKIRRKTGF